MKLRVGLIGLGDAWQQRHASALRALGDRFEVRCVFDQVAHRAEQIAGEFHALPIEGFRALSRREDVDVVMVLDSHWYGALPLLAACEAGKAVYWASGVDINMQEAELIKRRVEASGVAFMAEFPRRHAPATIRLKELIATRLGRPQIVFCHQRSPALHGNNHLPTKGDRQAQIRELLELVDWCCYVVDRSPSWVTGLVHSRDRKGGPDEDYQMMTLDFSSPEPPGMGPVAQISCGRYIPARWHEAISYRPLAGMQVSCENGIAFVDLPSTLIWFDDAGRHQESLESERPVGEQLLTQFHRAVTSLLRRTNDLEDAYRALRIVQQARHSHEEGRRIELWPVAPDDVGPRD
ncbi:MAG: Gfo/Idh/MocA family protein [Planctomycetota bacterium]